MTLDPEEWIVSFSDVKRLYISKWRGLIKWAFAGAFLALFYFGNLTSKYRAEASFKEGMEKTSPDSLVKELMGGGAEQLQATSLMKSYQVLKPLVEKMGLQIGCPNPRWLFSRVVNRFREALRAEKGLPLEDLDPFLFQDVAYEEEGSLSFTLFFTDATHFTIHSADKKEEMGKGTVGTETHFSHRLGRFTVVKTPKKLKIGAFYPFHISHWASAANALRSQIKIKNDKDNRALVNVSFSHRDRHLAAQLANELMNQYQGYLKREYDHLAKEQLTYLEGKQEQIFGKMEELFDQHTAYLSKNLEENGFIGLDQEVEKLLLPHHEMSSKVISIEVELSRLDQMEKEERAMVLVEGPFSQGLHQISQQIQELKQQRDLLELSLCQITQHALEGKREELKEIRNHRYAVEKLIQEVDRGGEISSFDINPGLCHWAKSIRDLEEREDFGEYLENYARLLSIREKMIQERFFYGDNAPAELEGMDLSLARSLFLKYNSDLDAAENSLRHYAQLKKEIPQPDFDLASLSTLLIDPLCQKVIEEAMNLGLHLKDEKHRSSKEGERWREEIALHRNILMNHLDQLIKVEELNAALIREKMAGLQKVSLDCINCQISVLHEQIHDSIKQRRQALLLEKALLEKKMGKMRAELAVALPEKWRFEKWLNIKTEMVSKVMEAVTEVVESKTISNHLHHVESKPLDCALVPTAPQPPRLYRMMCLGAFALPFLIFCLSFIRRILHGFPVSLEKLKALRLPVLGSVSAFCDGPSVEMLTGPDLEFLRQLALFAKGSKVISLLAGRGPDYSYALGENLAHLSAKAIILRCDFLSTFREEDTPGLLQVWKGEVGELPIRRGKGFDYICAGGYSLFGTEIIQSPPFLHLIDLLKKSYDAVFLLFRTPLASVESSAALGLCEKAVVTVSQEQIEELTPFVNWAYHEDHCRLTFITPI